LYRYRDFKLMNVCDLNGKKLGFINDLILNFKEGKISGFGLCSHNFLNNNVTVSSEDIVCFDKCMVVKKVQNVKIKYLNFREICNCDIVNEKGQIIGLAQDILIDENTFRIKGIVVSKGIVNDFICGKKIILIDQLCFGDKYILGKMSNEKIRFDVIAKTNLQWLNCGDENE
jgi:uncharacterized protein YrrD